MAERLGYHALQEHGPRKVVGVRMDPVLVAELQAIVEETNTADRWTKATLSSVAERLVREALAARKAAKEAASPKKSAAKSKTPGSRGRAR